MPIKVQNDLPAKKIMEKENIFIMNETRAVTQNIRPLQIAILNLMPLKEDTEIQMDAQSVQYTSSVGNNLFDNCPAISARTHRQAT